MRDAEPVHNKALHQLARPLRGRTTGERWCWMVRETGRETVMTKWLPCLLAFSMIAAGSSGIASAQQPKLIAGILEAEPYGCTALLSPPERWYLIDDLGDFAAGDTVVVYAQSVDQSDCDGHQSYEHLVGVTISAWRDFDFGCGIITIDQEWGCEWFHTARFGRLSAWGLAQYATGDSVRAFGNLWVGEPCPSSPECGGGCSSGVTHVQACDDTSTAVSHVTWGRLKARYRDGWRDE